jgi:hypothetical protein
MGVPVAAPKVRRWSVSPDHVIDTETYGEVPAVSRQAMVEAIMDGEAMLARTGGILIVHVGRHPTDLPGEAITTHAVVEHRDGARAQVEQPAPVAEPEPVEPEEPAASPDGFDHSQLEEEDLSSIPEVVS